MKYITVTAAAALWGVNQPRVRQWLKDGRIKGATKLGRDWLIPANAVRPPPARPGELKRAT